MGFGSYDESEQENQETEIETDDGVNIHEKDHDGEVAFETDASSEELVDRLQDMKDDEEEDE
jgi:hypothetical protein